MTYALARGRWPERYAAVSTTVALLVGWLFPPDAVSAYQYVEIEQATIDVLLLGGLLFLAARADRFWPMWLAAMQLTAVALHGVKAYDAALLPIIYNRLVEWVGYLMLLTMTVGTWRHQKRRLVADETSNRD